MISHADALLHEEYCKIPAQLLASLDGYARRRETPGHFLIAVLSHELFDAVSRADKESYAALRELVTFIHMELPSEAHGNMDKVAHWLHPKRHVIGEVCCQKCGIPAAFPNAIANPENYICLTCK